MNEEKSPFEVMNAVNVNEHTEKKNGLTYLSWAWAWGELKKFYPDATYTIYENANGWFYHTDGKTAWVKTGVTVNGLENIEYLPVMDYKNRSIPVESITSVDVNKAVQRSMTKAVARHGLGLYIYAGEDLPEAEAEAAQKQTPSSFPEPVTCENCGNDVIGVYGRNGDYIPGYQIAEMAMKKFGRNLCSECMKAAQDAKRGAADGT